MNDEKAGDYFEKIESYKASLWKGGSTPRGRLDIELTERCNNNCIHCYINLPADDHEAKARELSTNQLKDILKEAASLSYMSVRFTGGEPLLREDFEELYIFARKLGLKVLIFTNATLISPHLADLLAHIPPLEKMEITVYGMKKKSYEAVTRTPGSYEAAWRGINLLLEKQIPFFVKGTILPPSRGELDEFEAWASTVPWIYWGPSFPITLDLRGRRDSERKNRLIKGLRLPSKEILAFLIRRPEEYLKSRREFCSKFMKPGGDVLFTCGSAISSVCVDAYGYLLPCMLLKCPDVVYDLKNGSLKDALTNFLPQIRKIKASNPEYLARCARCFLKGLCEQCPAKSWIEHGTLDTPVEYLCEIAHEQARYLGLIEDGENAWEVKDWKERVRNLPKTEAERQSIVGKKNHVKPGR
jgi:radical SAM protein with 4Fe4S-binding SPASM domain